MKTLKKIREIVKINTINKQISDPNLIKPPWLHVCISSVIQFDKCFHLIVLYENYLIGIFIIINENLINFGKTTGINNGV